MFTFKKARQDSHQSFSTAIHHFFFWVFLPLHLASKPWLFTATATAAMLPAAGDAAASSVGFCSCFSVENGGSYDDYIDGSGNRGCMHCKRSDPSSSSSCYSCSSLWLDLAPFKDSEKLRRVITASAKGFSIGAGLKGGLALFSILTRLRRRQSSASSRKIEDFSNKEAITMAIKETIRYGLFLGTFAGTFVSVDEIIGALGGHRRQCSTSFLHFFFLPIPAYY